MQIIGHRGARGLAPENTIAGIVFALGCKVDWIEVDVHATKDGEVVVLHDATLNRIAHAERKVQNYTIAELQKIATKSGEAIPIIDEVFVAVRGRAKLNIELKSTRCAQKVINLINDEVANGREYTDFMISSFYPWLLADAQRLQPAIPRALLHGPIPIAYLLVPFLKLHAVGFSRFFAPSGAIWLAKKLGLWTYVYTVNSQTEVDAFAKKGVDAIVTDVPQNFKTYRPLRTTIWLLATILIALLIFALWPR